MINNLESFMKQNNMVENDTEKDYELKEEPIQIIQNDGFANYFKVVGSFNSDMLSRIATESNIQIYRTADPLDFVAERIVNKNINSNEELQPLFRTLNLTQQSIVCDKIKEEIENIIEEEKEVIDNRMLETMNVFVEGATSKEEN